MRPPPILLTTVFASRLSPQIIHAVCDQDSPIGRARFLWEIQFEVAPLDVRHPDAGSLSILLATLRVNPRGGEELVSLFRFTGLHAMLLYAPPPNSKILQLEYRGRILLSLPVCDSNLDKGFRDIYPLLRATGQSPSWRRPQ